MTKLLKIALLILAVIIAVQTINVLRKDKWQLQQVVQMLQDENNDMSEEIARLHQNIVAANARIEQYEQQKIVLENKSIALQNELSNAIKENKCTNAAVPTAAADKLRARVDQLRQAAGAR